MTMVLFGDSWKFNLLVLFIGAFALFYWFVKQKYTYWERKGFKSLPNSKFLLGHFGPAITQKMFIGELIAHIYKNIDEPFVGIYGFLWPFLLLRDPQTIRNILIKDFQYFTDRTYKKFSDHLPFSFTDFRIIFSVFTLTRWRTLR